MEKEELYESLFTLIPEGMFADADELGELIEDEGLEAVFPLIPEGMFEDEEEFLATFGGEKKKDSPSAGPTPSTESPIEQPTETGEENIFAVDYGVDSQVDNQVDFGAPVKQPPPITDPVGTKFGANVDAAEKNTWLEEMLGKNEVTDFFGDIYRAAAQGIGQGATIDDARRLFVSGSDTSEEDVQKYIAAVQRMDNYAMSDEMKSFNRIYEANGGGLMGFILGVGENPTVLGQLFVSSVASMINADVLAGAAATGAAGAGVGSLAAGGAASVGGPLGTLLGAVGGAAGGGVSGAILGASATLETGLAFTEFMKEEVEKAGLKFDAEGVKNILANPDALQRIRNKAMARGIVIGGIDAFTRGAASKLAGAPIKAAKAADKAISKGMKARAALTAAGIEAVGGSTGEATARAVTGQEEDTAEILFEGVTGQVSSLLSVPQAVSGMSLTEIGNNMVGKGKNFFKPPSYGYLTKKGTKMLMSKQDVEAAIDTMTAQEIIDSQFVIENDTALEQKYENRRQEANLNQQTPDNLKGERRKRYIELLQEKSNMENPDTPENKERLKAIDEELDAIVKEAETDVGETVNLDGIERYFSVTQLEAIQALKEQGIDNPTDTQVKNKQKELLKLAVEAAKRAAKETVGFKNTKELEDEAKDQLISEGILEPTDQQIKERANAIQESSTTQVDVQESTPDSPEVGEGDAPGVVTPESQTQEQVADQPIETQTQEEISVNIAPFYETSIESTNEAAGLRKSPQYEQYKQGIQDTANELGIEIEIDEGVGGYVNDAGTKIREISNVVRLKKATLQQAAEFASMLAALSPEVQESSIAAEYVADDSPGVTGQEYTLEVSDAEGTFQALKEVGIDEYTLNESNNLLTLFKFNDATEVDVLNKLQALKDNLDGRNIQHTAKTRESIKSEYITVEERKSFLTTLRRNLINQGKEGTNLYKKVISAINRDAENQGISPNEYIGSPTAPEVTADPNRVQSIINDIIKKTKGRKVGESTSPKKILDNTLKYLQNSKLYQQLNDTERNQLVRELNEKLGIKIKKAPSVKKVLGKPKDKKVVVNERVALKDQIRKEAKAARESAAAYKKSLKNIAAQITGFGKKLGKISTSKVNAITKRFANVNLNSKKSVDNFLTFVDNVFTKADYLTKLKTARTFARKAKKQVGGAKTGALPVDLKTALETLFSVDISLVPEAQLDSYIELAREYGSGKKVLDLRPAEETMPIILDVLNAVEENMNGLNQEVIESTPAEIDVDAEVSEIVGLQKEISNAEVNNIANPRAREDARTLRGLTPKQIFSLARKKKDGTIDYSNIRLLNQVLKNIKNGFAGKSVTDLVTRLNAVEAADAINPKIKKLSFKKIQTGLTDIYSKTKSLFFKRGAVTERIRNLSTFFVDDVLGNFNSKLIYNNTFGKLARAYETYKSKVAKIEAMIDAADQVLFSDSGRKLISLSRNAVVKKKYKLRILQLQREHESNMVDGKPNPKAPSAIDFINSTIEAIVDGKILSQIDADILNELKTEFEVDGQISLEKVENSLTAKEKKALALYDEANGSLAAEAEFISANLHGNKINLLNNYTHHAVLQSKDGSSETVLQKLKRFQNVLDTKSGTVVERTNGAKPISFDPGYSAIRGAQETFLDFEMTQPMREVDMTINELEGQMKEEGTKDALKGVRALKKAKDEIVQTIFKGSFSDMTGGGILNLKVQRLGYQAALASIPRAVAEVMANLFVMVTSPKIALRGFSRFGKFVANPKKVNDAVDAMTALNSSQTSKMFDTDALSSKHSQMVDYGGRSSRDGAAVSRMENLFGELLKYTGVKSVAKLTDKVASKIITFPDQMMARPLWFGSWATAFEAQVKKETGKTIKITSQDFSKIADGTSQYLSPEYKKARDIATARADAKTITLATSNNPFDSIIKNMRRVDDSTRMSLYRMANSYMARFSLYEYGTARNAILAMFKKGDMDKTQAAALLAGVTMRMSAYMVVYSTLTSLLDDELFDAEDYRDDDVEDVMARQMIGSVLTLITRGSLGNLPNIPLSFALEYGINEPALGDLRDNKEYDPYFHSIVFSLINKEDLSGPPEEVFMEIMAGPYGPLMRTLSRIVTLSSRAVTSKQMQTRKRAEEELTERMTIEIMGNLGLLPFYKDIRRIMLKDRFAKNPNILTPAQEKLMREQGLLFGEDDVLSDDVLEGDTMESDDILED